jgi:hypothetical protein
MPIAAALTEIEALKTALDEVCDQLMVQAEAGLDLTANPSADATQLTAIFSEILSLCAFQDLAGQRLNRMAAALSGASIDTRPDAHLLNGPANAGGLDQSSADALFADEGALPGEATP